MMRITPAFLVFALAPGVGAAQDIGYCEDAWLTRNMIFDRAGHCFGSTLGQTLFDNGDCNAAGAQLSVLDTELVARIRAGETHVGCSVNTSSGPSAAMVAAHAQYRTLEDIPARDELGWACWGYLGAPITLHAGARADSPVVGQLLPGSGAVFLYWPRGNWSFAEVVTGPGGGLIAQGWLNASFPEGICEQVAG